jgi:hypothetical protein
MAHIEISSRADLEKFLKGAKRADLVDKMRGESSRTCPHCGWGKQHRHGSGRFVAWTPCDNPLCNAQPYAKKIRVS